MTGDFASTIKDGYAFEGPAIDLGRGVQDGKLAGRRGWRPPPSRRRRPSPRKEHKEAAKAPAGGMDTLGDFLGSREGQRSQKKVARGLFGLLKKSL